MPARKPPPRARPAPSAAPPEPAQRSVPAVSTRYRVVSGGISTPGGPVWTGEIMSAERLGDETRVAKLLERGAIVEVADAD